MKIKEILLVLFNGIRLLRFRIGDRISAYPIQSFSMCMKFVLQNKAKLILGRNVISDGRGSIYVGEGASVKIGAGTYFNDGIKISCKKGIEIGEHCLFGPDVKIYDNNHKFSRENGVSSDYTADNIKIGNNCWIASNVVILKGTVIGDNSVIGAGCILSETIPAGSLVKMEQNLKIIPIEGK